MKFLKFALVILVSSLTSYTVFSNELLNGKFTSYFDDGSKKSDRFYKDSVPIGTWKSWYNNGNLQSVVEFLDSTGQIEKVEMLHKDGSLMFKGVATINNKPGDPEMTIAFVSDCSARTSMKGDGSKWYNKYELNHSSYYEDGSCEKAKEGNMTKTIAQLYFRANDNLTNKTYDFPWYQLWDTVFDYLKK